MDRNKSGLWGALFAAIFTVCFSVGCEEAEPVEHAWMENKDNLKKAAEDFKDSTAKVVKPAVVRALDKTAETLDLLQERLQ